MKTLVLADDHALLREGICGLLEAHPDIQVLGDFETGSEAWNAIDKHRPDLALLDQSMPHLSGAEVAQRVRDADLRTQVLVLTQHNEPAIIANIQASGARGLIAKGEAFEELVTAIRTVLRGETYLSESLSRLEDVPILTTREQEVLPLLAKGMSNRETAKTLGVSPKTIDSHRSSLMKKFEVHGVVELISEALRLGFL